MKLCSVVLFAGLIASIQGRSVTDERIVNGVSPSAGQHPWLLHLRFAVRNGGRLDTCAGSLVAHRWALTSATCMEHASFIWVRYNAVTVVNPELVTETSAIVFHPTWAVEEDPDAVQLFRPLVDLALVSLNRHIEFTDTINLVPLADSTFAIADNAEFEFCAWGAIEDGAAMSEVLQCATLQVTSNSVCNPNNIPDLVDIVCLASQGNLGQVACQGDNGAPLVWSGVQVGVLSFTPEQCNAQSFAGGFVNPGLHSEWIQSVINPEDSASDDDVVNGDDDDEADDDDDDNDDEEDDEDDSASDDADQDDE